MWRTDSQCRWLGPGAHVQFRDDVRCGLTDESGPWRNARVVEWQARLRLVLMVEPAAAWTGHPATCVTIAMAVDGDGCRVTITEADVDAARRDEVQRYWQRRLERLQALAGRVNARRASVRQAVVVIHGIGEQEPGTTLNNLARSGVLSAPGGQMWVKPDRLSDSYELRRLTLKASSARPTTDVFELYWAHIIRDTTLGQIASWLKGVLLRWPVPAPLRPLWFLAWGLGAVSLALAVAAARDAIPAWLAGTAISGAAVLVWKLVVQPLAIDVLGDAARYLVPRPANIAHRQAIRSAGVNLIEKLHASGDYDRIVILGHSLGSVIAYDIITHAWAAMNAQHRRPAKPAFADIAELERQLDLDDAVAAQALQHAAWRRTRTNTQPWLITDLVTCGSPLTYADLLMAASPTRFAQAKANRILPTCPPASEVQGKKRHRRISFELPYRDAIDGQQRTFAMLHHAAPFAVTRWTNLYFTAGRLGLSGDIVGGPVAPLFGKWVRDVPLAPPRAGFAHTWYWQGSDQQLPHLAALRDALGLATRDELLTLLEALPASALLDDDGE